MPEPVDEIREARRRLKRLYRAAIGSDAYPSGQWYDGATDDHLWLTALLSMRAHYAASPVHTEGESMSEHRSEADKHQGSTNPSEIGREP